MDDSFGADAGGADKDEEILAEGGGEDSSPEDRKFDEIVGAIEDVMMDLEFSDTQERWCRDNCGEFEDTAENKLVYTELFGKYTDLVETMLDRKLKERIDGFSMAEFMDMVSARRDQIAGDVFDMLLSLGDFDEFKSLMVSYKTQVDAEAGGGGAEAGAGGGFEVGGGLMLAPTVINLEPASSGGGGSLESKGGGARAAPPDSPDARAAPMGAPKT